MSDLIDIGIVLCLLFCVFGAMSAVDSWFDDDDNGGEQ